ncbi:TetR/AcrR family transcriptional regulator [Phenylobacterium terrae]|uniref:TetR/AcrR family transcriptional regulator n=1 Tax=Phenylobacterium terrae TaxID=2665495 RepID=A0ABW4NA62_9CAUL
MTVQRRRLEPEARRQEILEAAERLLRAHGPGVRIDEVVREVGVARGTFYLYFPTWDDLLEAVRARLFEAFDHTYPLPSEVRRPVDWPAALDWLVEAFVDFTVGLGGLHDAIFHSDFAQRRPSGDDAVVRLTAIIRAGQEAGSFAAVDAEPTARLLFAAIHEATDAVAAGADRDRTFAALRHILRGSLCP